jgi:hypothetical protein
MGFNQMGSQKPNAKKRSEKQYYEPIRACLGRAMSKYLDPERVLQDRLAEDMPKRVYLEIIGGKNVFPEDLKKVFDDDTLNIIRDEGIYPDLVGFVQKNSQSPKEIIIAEIKDVPITLKMVAKAKFYKEIFNASFAFLVSTRKISEERVRFLLKKPLIKDDVIIAKYVHSPQFNMGHIEINAKFKETIPDFLHFWLRPKETEPARPKSGFFTRLLKR